jgi:hypothetical protein
MAFVDPYLLLFGRASSVLSQKFVGSDSSPGQAGGFGKCEPLKAAVTEPLRGSLNPLKGD